MGNQRQVVALLRRIRAQLLALITIYVHGQRGGTPREEARELASRPITPRPLAPDVPETQRTHTMAPAPSVRRTEESPNREERKSSKESPHAMTASL
jgi:hypothetical protein